jgi:hypothetical protein
MIIQILPKPDYEPFCGSFVAASYPALWETCARPATIQENGFWMCADCQKRLADAAALAKELFS